ncbi:MAG TPA: hypothetical protein VF412_08060 [Bdellovibrio sp.]|uniref:hypothetical protein n=1 Tax=Bdellovibrio sp. TaxID=28201 RepID=UPI002F075BED
MAESHNHKESHPRSDIWGLFRPRSPKGDDRLTESSQELDNVKQMEDKTETVVLDSEGHRNRINHY